MLPAIPKPSPQPTPGLPTLSVEMWLNILFGNTSFSYTRENWNLFLSQNTFQAAAMRWEFAKYLGYDAQQQCDVDSVFYSESRGKVFFGQVIYDLQTKFISFAFPTYIKNVRYFHSEFASFYVCGNTVFAYGDNDNSQLGLGHSRRINTPTRVEIPGNPEIEIIVAGENSTFFITKDRRTFACGLNDDGQLGLGDPDLISTPTQIADLNGIAITTIVSCFNNTFFLNANGRVWACGSNKFSQLGLGHEMDERNPRPILFFEGNAVRTIVVAQRCVFFITREGAVFASGTNFSFMMGIGGIKQTTLPMRVTIPNEIPIRMIVTYTNLTFFIGQDGSVFTCGDNSFCQLGISDKFDFVDSPIQVALPQNVVIETVVNEKGVSYFIAQDGRIFECGARYDATLDQRVFIGGRVSSKLTHRVSVAKYFINSVEKYIFITEDGRIASLTEGEFTTVVDFRMLLPQQTITESDVLRQLETFKNNEPIYWLKKTSTGAMENINFTLIRNKTPDLPPSTAEAVFMTRWLLSYPMKKLKKTLSNTTLSQQDITQAKQECNVEFTELLDLIDLKKTANPLLLEHTKKSITPEVMNLAHECLNQKNAQRLIGYLSPSQAQQRLSVTTPSGLCSG
ncbi:MAG: hypothetical protein K5Q00_02425 [Gammaproteobacteria bacterium]|nr:hypothetical protein [Gammaproteobacteria bacterium]